VRLVWMASVGILSVGILSASSAPSMARDYPWCMREQAGSPNCSFDTLQQCQATISGLIATCVQNPAMLFNQQTQQRPPAVRQQEFRQSVGGPGGPGGPAAAGAPVRSAPGKHGWYYE
jgi:hypothetical protein